MKSILRAILILTLLIPGSYHFRVQAAQASEENEEDPIEPIFNAQSVNYTAVPNDETFLNRRQIGALNRLFIGLEAQFEGEGLHMAAEQMSFYDFLLRLDQYLGEMSEDTHAILKKTGFSENSPASAWLEDNGFHPLYAPALEALIHGRGLDEAIRLAAYEKITRQSERIYDADLQQEVVRILRLSVGNPQAISYRVPWGYAFTGSQGLGALFNGQAVDYTRQRAFDLKDGKPKRFDPDLANLLEHVKKGRGEMTKGLQNVPRTRLQRIAEQFHYLDDMYKDNLDTYESVELMVYDLQGLIDSIRYKLSLTELSHTPETIEKLKSKLDRVIQMKRQLAEAVTPLFNHHPHFKALPLKKAYKIISRFAGPLEQMRRSIRRFSAQFVNEVDIILGVDIDEIESVLYDTPYEFAVTLEMEAAQAAGLMGNWEDLRTFRVLTEHRLITRRWTETKIEWTGSGKNRRMRVRTVTKTSRKEERDYMTIPTPRVEVTRVETLNDIIEAMQRLRGQAESADLPRQIDALIARARRLEAVQIEYYQTQLTEPTEDEAEHYLARNKIFILLIRNTIDQLKVMKVRGSTNIATFDRSPLPHPGWVDEARGILQERDARNGARVDTAKKVALGVGATVAAGTLSYCAYLLLGPDLMRAINGPQRGY